MSLWNSIAWGQQTAAARALASKRSGRIGGRRSAAKRRRKAKVTRKTARRRTRSKSARLVKGSAAAKRYMASIRRKRKK